MRLVARSLTLLAGAALAFSSTAAAATPPSGVATFVWSSNMTPLSEALAPVPFSGPGASVFNSDIAFWGQRAYQGTYNGFNVIDISDPENIVKLIDYNDCAPDTASGPSSSGNQGDVVVWGGTTPNVKKASLLIRAWGSGTSTNPATAPIKCGGEDMLPGYEGVNIFDISDELNPDHVKAVYTTNGAHTLSLVPDLGNNRLLIYQSSSGGENGITIIGVPLDDPASAAEIRFESNARAAILDPVTGATLIPAAVGRSCHDTSSIMGSAMKVACSGGNGYAMWNADPNDPEWGVDPIDGTPASWENPVLMRSLSISATTGHQASFSYDGTVFLFGSEPGGGSGASCRETGANSASTDRNKSIRFFDVRSGVELGRHVLPRPQEAQENCTIHNFNVVPLPRQGKKPVRNVVVHGSYQSGIGVVDFTDIRNPIGLVTDPNLVNGGDQHANLTTREIAFADPAPLSPSTPIVLGGSWSAFWYDGFIYDSDIRRGVFSWKLSDPAVAGALKLRHLNAQTQEFTIQ